MSSLPDEVAPVELESRELGLARFPDINAIECSVGGATFWAPGETINVCFIQELVPGTMTGINTLAMRNDIRDRINESWGRAVSLRFNWSDNCPSPIPATTISIYLRDAAVAAVGGTASPGKRNRLTTNTTTCNRTGSWNNRADVQVQIQGPSLTDELRRVALHEFGHVLGFRHEFERTDNPHMCPSEVPAGPDTPNRITVYDPPSILSYCAATYRQGLDFTLTSLDILGAEMTYPPALTGRTVACVDQCFQTGSGGAIVRTGGTLTSNWKARGALSLPVSWTSVTGPRTAEFVPASSLPAGTNTFSFSHSDPLARTNTGSVAVTKSDSVHAAILQHL